jgi:hypothetical protein
MNAHQKITAAGIPMKERDLHLYAAQTLRLFGKRDLIWFHPVNEGARSARTGAFLKKMGMKPGVPDFALVLPGGRAAFLELKQRKGRQSVEQKAFQLSCEQTGVPYRVARSPEEVSSILTEWGAIAENPLRVTLTAAKGRGA